MYLLWLFRLWYCSKCLAVMNCSAVALWYCSMNKSVSLFYWFYTNDYIQKNPKPKYFFHFFQKILLTSQLPWSSVQIYHDFGKNTSTCTKKWYFLINEFQKNTIFTPIFVYFLYYLSAFIPLITYIYIREKNKKNKTEKTEKQKKIYTYKYICAFLRFLCYFKQ